MDGAQFDRLSRLAARTPTSTRRAALGFAAALGLGGQDIEAGKKGKGKNACKGGCGPCRVCRKKGNARKCVTAPDGAACDGGACRSGTCACTPATCASLGQACGTASDGCGGTLTCGAPCPCVAETCAALGNACGRVTDGCGGHLDCGRCTSDTTPACHHGRCDTCAATCPESCTACLSRPSGTTLCTSTFTAPCETPCTTDTDCPAETPVCVAVAVGRTNSITIDFPTLCGTELPGSCLLPVAC